MTISELETMLAEKGVPHRYYALDGKEHVERNWAIRKRFFHYEVYSIRFGRRFFIYKFDTESEACDFLYNKVITDCLYDDVKLNGVEPIKHKKPIAAPKWLHEEMASTAKRLGIDVTYTRDVHSITFKNGYKYETKHFFRDYFYKGNAIICLNSSNENNGHLNCINISNNVFMINNRGERVWTFNRNLLFPDRNVPVNYIGLSYEQDELYLTVYDDKHYRPIYVLDPMTGHLLRREEMLCPPWRHSITIVFRKKLRHRGIKRKDENV